MANNEHLAKVKEGVAAWNAWRGANGPYSVDLSGADLSAADLIGANLYRADLREAKLARATLTDASLCRADLSGADLREADLTRVYLHEACLTGAILNEAYVGYSDLSNAVLGNASFDSAKLTKSILSEAFLNRTNLSRADLRWANFAKADLTGADLTEASVDSTIFGNNDLGSVRGLETVAHHGPSTIGIDTIYRSQGKIPLAFLRGAGVPDNFIAYMGSLTGKALEFYSCFISYSSKDQDFADRLHADLQNKGVRCWFAPHNMRGGEYTHVQIDRAIQINERLLLILSPNSMKSKWVETEIVKARKRETTEDKRVLFPVRLAGLDVIRDWECFDSDTGEDLGREIRKYHIPDFSDWKNHDPYAEGLKNLLRDLKAEQPKMP